ncbi:unnamed protein product [Agarophyton chilense]
MAELMMQNAWPPQTPRSVFARGSEMEGLLRGEIPTLYDATELICAAWGAIPEYYIARCWLEISILPEQHAAQLFKLHGRHEKSTSEQQFFSCCSDNRGESLKIVQTLIRDGAVSGRKVKESIAQRLCGVGQKVLDKWLDVEESQMAQSWMKVELENLVTRFGPVVSIDDESAFTEVSEFSAVRKVQLPRTGCILELLAPIQSIVDECESGRSNSILYQLKQELARVRAQQEQQQKHFISTVDASSHHKTSVQAENARLSAPVLSNPSREEYDPDTHMNRISSPTDRIMIASGHAPEMSTEKIESANDVISQSPRPGISTYKKKVEREGLDKASKQPRARLYEESKKTDSTVFLSLRLYEYLHSVYYDGMLRDAALRTILIIYRDGIELVPALEAPFGLNRHPQ